MAFHKSKNFKTINSNLLSKTFSLFSFKTFQKDDIIYEKDTSLKNTLCIVLEGNITDKNTNKTEAKRYEILFENELVNGERVIAKNNLVADPDCVIAEANYTQFQEAMGSSDIKTVQMKSNKMSVFDNIALFKVLTDEKKEILVSQMKTEKFENGKKIITQGEMGNKFFIIKKGRVDIYINSKYIRSLYEGGDFGEKSLVLNDKRSSTVIANGQVICYTLTDKVFKSILEPNLMDYFQKKFYLEDNTIELQDLDHIKLLGKGSYGFVCLTRYKKNKQLYAVKALNNIQIKKEKLTESVELEKNVLLKIDHPFIMKMVKYLKNENFIFFITEYIRGKELWEVIRDIGFLNKEQTMFYGGSLLLAMDYLHKKKIVYRDIKPENIMINEKGYVKLIDFGTVKEIKERTSTIVGTPYYMAPEMIKGMGYSFEVDIWSIAVCMYEFFCGKLPFGNDLDDPIDVYSAVTKDDLIFPSFVDDIEFMSLINKMLNKSPSNRLWKFSQIKKEPYFQGFKWDDLISLAMTPPYQIQFKEEDNNDKSNIIPYLVYLKSQENGIKNPSSNVRRNSQIDFNNWLQNF